MYAIELKNVSKKYELVRDRPIILKNFFIRQKKEGIWALKDVSLNIKKGETIGIIGENGSGKSTLLKIIAGITLPTTGSVKVNGRVCSLIELGAGFHPDLTGKENVYLNATLLGLTKKEIDHKYNEIVEFADIGKFIDQPIRAYSSGMTVRLGFSVAVHLDPDILLIDEVLAVGDEKFQRKSLVKINQLKENAKTILFVSHNLPLIESQANRCIWLKNGKLKMVGLGPAAIEKYMNYVESKNEQVRKNNSPKVSSGNNNKATIDIVKLICLDKNKQRRKTFEPQGHLSLKIIFLPNREFESVMFGIAIFKENVYLFGSKKEIKVSKNMLKRENSIVLTFEHHPFLRGIYYISVGICQHNQWNNPIDFHKDFVSFEIKNSYKVLNYDGWIISDHNWQLIYE